MSSRALASRLARIEGSQPSGDLPSVIFGTRSIPDEPTAENVRRWIAEGKAHVGFNGHAIVYDGGERELTIDEWMAKYGPKTQG